MKDEQVVSILESLGAGIDPTTGSEIPHDLFHSPDVIRGAGAGVTSPSS